MLDDLLPEVTFLFEASDELIRLIENESNALVLDFYDIIELVAPELNLSRGQLSSAIRTIFPDAVGRAALKLLLDNGESTPIVYKNCLVFQDLEPFISPFGPDECLVVKCGQLPDTRPGCSFTWLPVQEASAQLAALIKDRTAHLDTAIPNSVPSAAS